MRLFLTLALTLAASTLAAQDNGTLQLTVNGTPVTYVVDPSQSDWTGGASMASMSIYARQSESDEAPRTLMIGVEQFGTLPPRLTDLTAMGSPTYAAPDDAATITLDDTTISDGTLSVSGSIEGTLAATPDFGRSFDMDDTFSVSGTFEAILPPLN